MISLRSLLILIVLEVDINPGNRDTLHVLTQFASHKKFIALKVTFVEYI